MKINLSSRCRYRDFRSNNYQIGDYLIEGYYSEPYIYKIIHKYDNKRIQLDIVAKIDYNGNVTLNKKNQAINYDLDKPHLSLKYLPKQHVHNLNKMIVFS